MAGIPSLASMADLARFIRHCPNEQFYSMLDHEVFKSAATPPAIQNAIAHLVKAPDPKSEDELLFKGKNPEQDRDMNYVELQEFISEILDDGIEPDSVMRLETVEAQQAYLFTLAGYTPTLITEVDVEDERTFALVIEKIKNLIDIRSNTDSTGKKVKVSTALGYGLVFQKGTSEEDDFRSGLTDSGKEELDRILRMTSSTRRSAICDIAETIGNKNNQWYSLEFKAKGEGLLRFEGKPFIRLKPSLIPSSVFEKMDDNYHRQVKWGKATGGFKNSRAIRKKEKGTFYPKHERITSADVTRYRKQDSTLKKRAVVSNNPFGSLSDKSDGSESDLATWADW